MRFLLHEIPNLRPGSIASRPSKTCKSPYVADVITQDNGSALMVHTPSLGCCGLVEKGSMVYISEIKCSKKRSPQTKPTCSHRAELASIQEGNHIQIIGVSPKLAETIAENALIANCIQGLTLRDPYSYTRETTMLSSRFDFAGVCKSGQEFVMEIKNVPLADYVDVPKKERRKYDNIVKNMKYTEKISYFPDGYRKNSTDVVSPRALKHIKELEEIARTTNKRAILCFVVQRTDVACFQPSNIDLTYKKAVQSAWMSGVEIKTIQVRWSASSGKCYFVRNDLPIHLFDTYGPLSAEDTEML